MRNTLLLTPFISQLHGKCESQYFYISSSLAALKQVSRPTGNFSSSCARCLRPRRLSGGGMADRMLTPSQPPRPDPALPSHPCAQRLPPPPSSLPLLLLFHFSSLFSAMHLWTLKKPLRFCSLFCPHALSCTSPHLHLLPPPLSSCFRDTVVRRSQSPGSHSFQNPRFESYWSAAVTHACSPRGAQIQPPLMSSPRALLSSS